jgi:hypothetical protein
MLESAEINTEGNEVTQRVLCKRVAEAWGGREGGRGDGMLWRVQTPPERPSPRPRAWLFPHSELESGSME